MPIKETVTTRVITELSQDEIIDCLLGSLDYKQLVEFVARLDDAVADIDFTRDLAGKMAKILYVCEKDMADANSLEKGNSQSTDTAGYYE